MPSSRQLPRGPATNELHRAAYDGSIERTVALLRRGVINIDQQTPQGFTPLIYAAGFGHLRIVRILLNKGANVAIVNDERFTALHFSAQGGFPAVTKALVKAGADLEAKTYPVGATPLHSAAVAGHSQVVRVLIEAGANPNSRRLDDSTPLFCAAKNGHVDTVQVLLRANASPLLTFFQCAGTTFVPLDVAAQGGHLEVARELIQEHGIDGCGGASAGVDALRLAAMGGRVDMMDLLTRAGVVDTGGALLIAVSNGCESSVQLLLKQQEWKASGERAGYLDARGKYDETPLLWSSRACRSCSPRITRMLVDAGADTTSAVELKAPDGSGKVVFNDTPLAYTNFLLKGRVIRGEEATESQLYSLEGIRRLLMRVEAVHAVSWLWTRGILSVTRAAAQDRGRATVATSTPPVSILPILRRRAGRPRVLLAALSRHSGKPY